MRMMVNPWHRHWCLRAAVAVVVALALEGCLIGVWEDHAVVDGVRIIRLDVYLVQMFRPVVFSVWVYAILLGVTGDGVTRCGTCGKKLSGLAEPRCPHCGAPF